MARVTRHIPYYLSHTFNHLRDSKSILGPQYGLILVHIFVDRLSSTLVQRVELTLSIFCLTWESSDQHQGSTMQSSSFPIVLANFNRCNGAPAQPLVAQINFICELYFSNEKCSGCWRTAQNDDKNSGPSGHC